MRTKYKASEKMERRKIRLDVVFALFFVILFVGGGGYIIYDLNLNRTQIDDSQNRPIHSEVLSSNIKYKTVENDDYTLRIPEDWEEINRPQRIFEEGIRYYPYKYQGFEGDSAGRWLEVYVDRIPVIPVEKIVEVEAQSDRLAVGEFSPQCIDIVDYDTQKYNRNADVEGEWGDLSFECRLSTIGNTIAAVETDAKKGYTFSVSGKKKTYLLVFADHGSSEDNTIFRSILESFRSK